jgi:hypothetical protein
MIDEAIAMAEGRAPGHHVELAHRSVEEALAAWSGREFNDLDAPYLMIGDEVKIKGREWRSASAHSVASILTASWTQR